MEETKDGVAFKGVAERLTLGVIRILENMPGVADVRFAEREPAEKRSLLSWEQRNGCILPEDLRDFYLTTDGFSLHWSVKLDNESAPLGRMVVNSVARLVPLVQPLSLFSLPNAPSLQDLDWDDSSQPDAVAPPHFDSRSRIFELDSCGGNGKVCLVYNNCSPGVVAQSSEVWFLDRSLGWHFLSSSFTSFYRLLITHLGLPEWEYSYTPYGASPQARWASLYQPLIFSEPEDVSVEPPLNRLDPGRAFRAKTKTPPKKKSSAPSAGGGGRAAAGRGTAGGGAKR